MWCSGLFDVVANLGVGRPVFLRLISLHGDRNHQTGQLELHLAVAVRHLQRFGQHQFRPQFDLVAKAFQIGNNVGQTSRVSKTFQRVDREIENVDTGHLFFHQHGG